MIVFPGLRLYGFDGRNVGFTLSCWCVGCLFGLLSCVVWLLVCVLDCVFGLGLLIVLLICCSCALILFAVDFDLDLICWSVVSVIVCYC